jgi:predicted nucleic acid-binding protein
MNVYIESNFLLELAFDQEERESCHQILRLCERRKAALIVPAFCLVESYHALVGRHGGRREILQDVKNHFTHLARSKKYANDVRTLLPDLTRLLVATIEEETKSFRKALGRILKTVQVIPLDPLVLKTATRFEDAQHLGSQDSIVLASVLRHLRYSERRAACFLTRDRKHFDKPDIVKLLRQHGCALLVGFSSGLRHIKSAARSSSCTS